MSISLGDTLYIPAGDMHGWWVARILSPNGQVFLHRSEDAIGSTKWGPNPNTLLKQGAKKLSVDPIGRIRPAND
jgi:CRISPR-associated endonuclease Csn1